MSLLTRVSLLAITLTLSACSSIQTPPVEVPEGSVPVMRLEASGEQIFQCSRDMKGWFWRFETPNAYLFDPATNQAVAKHGYRFSFAHNDGSTIYTRIIRVGEMTARTFPKPYSPSLSIKITVDSEMCVMFCAPTRAAGCRLAHAQKPAKTNG